MINVNVFLSSDDISSDDAAELRNLHLKHSMLFYNFVFNLTIWKSNLMVDMAQFQLDNIVTIDNIDSIGRWDQNKESFTGRIYSNCS